MRRWPAHRQHGTGEREPTKDGSRYDIISTDWFLPPVRSARNDAAALQLVPKVVMRRHRAEQIACAAVAELGGQAVRVELGWQAHIARHRKVDKATWPAADERRGGVGIAQQQIVEQHRIYHVGRRFAGRAARIVRRSTAFKQAAHSLNHRQTAADYAHIVHVRLLARGEELAKPWRGLEAAHIELVREEQ
jgi:hypothetical protein